MTNYCKRKILANLAFLEGKLEKEGNENKAGPQIEPYLSLFRDELGKRDARYLDITVGFDWCCAFVYYLTKKAGFNLKVKPLSNSPYTFGFVGMWYDWALVANKFLPRTITPLPGDIILFNQLLSSVDLDHIGIVIGVDDSYLITAEGNVNNKAGIFKREKSEILVQGYVRL